MKRGIAIHYVIALVIVSLITPALANKLNLNLNEVNSYNAEHENNLNFTYIDTSNPACNWTSFQNYVYFIGEQPYRNISNVVMQYMVPISIYLFFPSYRYFDTCISTTSQSDVNMCLEQKAQIEPDLLKLANNLYVSASNAITAGDMACNIYQAAYAAWCSDPSFANSPYISEEVYDIIYNRRIVDLQTFNESYYPIKEMSISDTGTQMVNDTDIINSNIFMEEAIWKALNMTNSLFKPSFFASFLSYNTNGPTFQYVSTYDLQTLNFIRNDELKNEYFEKYINNSVRKGMFLDNFNSYELPIQLHQAMAFQSPLINIIQDMIDVNFREVKNPISPQKILAEHPGINKDLLNATLSNIQYYVEFLSTTITDGPFFLIVNTKASSPANINNALSTFQDSMTRYTSVLRDIQFYNINNLFEYGGILGLCSAFEYTPLFKKADAAYNNFTAELVNSLEVITSSSTYKSYTATESMANALISLAFQSHIPKNPDWHKVINATLYEARYDLYAIYSWFSTFSTANSPINMRSLNKPYEYYPINGLHSSVTRLYSSGITPGVEELPSISLTPPPVPVILKSKYSFTAGDIAMVVIIPIVVIAICIGVGILICKRKRAKKQKQIDSDADNSVQEATIEIEGDQADDLGGNDMVQ